MSVASRTLTLATRGRGFTDFTATVRQFVADNAMRNGLVTVFCRHTSASLVIQENADPDVRADLERFFAHLVRDGDPLFEHTLEGSDDMPAHVRAALTQAQLSIPLVDGRLALGVWQGIYLWEHRTSGHRREVILQLIGN